MSETRSCVKCQCPLSLNDGLEWDCEEEATMCWGCQQNEIERLHEEASSDKARIAYIAGCGSDDGPLIEGLDNVLDDFWNFLGDAIRDRIGEENDSLDVEGTDEDKINAMRAMLDEAIAAEKSRSKESE